MRGHTTINAYAGARLLTVETLHELEHVIVEQGLAPITDTLQARTSYFYCTYLTPCMLVCLIHLVQ